MPGDSGLIKTINTRFIITVDGEGNLDRVDTKTRRIKKNVADSGVAAKRAKGYWQSFRMEMLGVMFAGMGLERVFGAQISRVNEMVGNRTMVEAFFTMALIKPMSDLQKLIIGPLFEAFTSLGSDTQGYIGYAIAGFAVLAGLVATGGALVLGISSVNTALMTLGITAGGLSFTPVATAFLATLASMGFVLSAGVWTAFWAWKMVEAGQAVGTAVGAASVAAGTAATKSVSTGTPYVRNTGVTEYFKSDMEKEISEMKLWSGKSVGSAVGAAVNYYSAGISDIIGSALAGVFGGMKTNLANQINATNSLILNQYP